LKHACTTYQPLSYCFLGSVPETLVVICYRHYLLPATVAPSSIYIQYYRPLERTEPIQVQETKVVKKLGVMPNPPNEH